jgi:hypothetical protein
MLSIQKNLIDKPGLIRHSGFTFKRVNSGCRIKSGITAIFCLFMVNFPLPNLSMAAQPIVPTSGLESPNAKRRAELVSLVRQDCGSCHGMTLKGGLGPALLPDVLKDKPAESLQATILQGRPGTAMPPWQRFLNEAEADSDCVKTQKSHN